MFAYILHFDTPLEHAQHYVGSTANLKQRLDAHAAGQGARLTQELFDRSLPWTLGGLFQTTTTNARRVERRLKESHNTPRFCEICTPSGPSTPPGATRYPMQEVPFPVQSTKIDHHTIDQHQLITVRQGFEPIDQLFASDVQKKNKEELGFLNSEALRTASESGKLLIVQNNDASVGFAIYTRHKSVREITIHQCAVIDEARMMAHGRSLIDAAAAMNPTCTIFAKVRDDLPANYFWPAVGFEKLRQITHRTSGSKLNVYFKTKIR